MLGRGRPAPRPGRWWRWPLLALLTLVGLVGLGWVVVWLRRDDPPPGTSVTQSPGPPASRAVHRVEPEQQPPPSLAAVTATRSTTAWVGSGDDLTRVQGIGARSATALAAAGIADLAALAGAGPAAIGDALTAAGLRRSPTYATWPGQARELLDRP